MSVIFAAFEKLVESIVVKDLGRYIFLKIRTVLKGVGIDACYAFRDGQFFQTGASLETVGRIVDMFPVRVIVSRFSAPSKALTSRKVMLLGRV